MPVFDLVALGSGGGPDERNLSCYLFKPHGLPWKDGMIALEAGSGIGALTQLLLQQPDLFGSQQVDVDEVSSYTAAQVYSWIRCFIISHAHLDHVNGLVLSAGSMSGPRIPVMGAQHCLEDIESIFSDRIWPKLASWSEDDPFPLLLDALPANGHYKPVLPSVSVRMMPISHGQTETLGAYLSSAFFIRHDPTAHEFLFFGDVEPDSLAAEPQNRRVWRCAAEKIPDTLNTIFIECSWTSGRGDDQLYGHLSPKHLSAELTALAVEVDAFRTRTAEANNSDDESFPTRKKQRRGSDSSPSLRGVLSGVRVYIIHCKDDIRKLHDQPVNQVIASEVRTLVDTQELGLEIIAVDQGMHISI